MASPLEEDILRRIRASGPMPFAAFMQLALYHPAHGYYATRAPGPGSDYRTSPSLGPWFGRLIGRALERMWRALGAPGAFTVVEVGGGGADLASAAIEAAGGPFARALRWRFVERFGALEKRQRERLAPAALSPEWVSALAEGPPVTGCVLANEVLDNLPVHLLEVRDGKAREVYVALEGGRLAEWIGPPSSPALAARAAAPPAHLEDGDRFELRMGVEGWCREAAAALERGYLLLMDYGDVPPDLWRRRPAGSLVTYRQGRLGTDPLASPGECDITAHVNFSDLEAAARAAGFEPLPLRSQRDFLRCLGIDDVAAKLREAQQAAAAGGRHAEAVSLLAERGRLGALTARGGLGDLQVFLAAKGTPAGF